LSIASLSVAWETCLKGKRQHQRFGESNSGKTGSNKLGVRAYLAAGRASYHRSYQGTFLEPVAFRVQLDTRLMPWVLKYAVASFSVSGNKNLLGCPKIIEELINEPW
jgi:hypothetical protein